MKHWCTTGGQYDLGKQPWITKKEILSQALLSRCHTFRSRWHGDCRALRCRGTDEHLLWPAWCYRHRSATDSRLAHAGSGIQYYSSSSLQSDWWLKWLFHYDLSLRGVVYILQSLGRSQQDGLPGLSSGVHYHSFLWLMQLLRQVKLTVYIT